MSKIYTVDASSWIEAGEHYYPPDIFAGLWHAFSALANTQRLLVPDEVFDEVDKQVKGLQRWLNAHKKQIIVKLDLDPRIQQYRREINRDHPGLIDPKSNKSGADAFLIAVGRLWSATVVTEEKSNGRRVKIPDVCRAYNIPCIGIRQMIRELGVSWPVPSPR